MLHLLGKNVFEVNLLHIRAETFLIFWIINVCYFFYFTTLLITKGLLVAFTFFYGVFKKQYQNNLVFTIFFL